MRSEAMGFRRGDGRRHPVADEVAAEECRTLRALQPNLPCHLIDLEAEPAHLERQRRDRNWGCEGV
eukprot:6204195-Pleurochrysis_carterae.AAC.2